MATTTEDPRWDSGKEDTHIEDRADSTPPGSDNGGHLSQWPVEEQNRIMRKVDVRLIPIAGFMYCVSLLDRTNLSNAAIAG
jgi:hypothetical protein